MSPYQVGMILHVLEKMMRGAYEKRVEKTGLKREECDMPKNEDGPISHITQKQT